MLLRNNKWLTFFGPLRIYVAILDLILNCRSQRHSRFICLRIISAHPRGYAID